MKKPAVVVTDHAILRHLERVQGIDIEAVRLELSQKVDAAVEAGAVAAVSNGIRYVLVGENLVSCVPVKSIPQRGGKKRRRVREAEDEA